MLIEEAANTNCMVFRLIWSKLEPMISHTRRAHANHYTNEAIFLTRDPQPISIMQNKF